MLQKKSTVQLSPERIQAMKDTMIDCVVGKLRKMDIDQLRAMLYASYDVLKHKENKQ